MTIISIASRWPVATSRLPKLQPRMGAGTASATRAARTTIAEEGAASASWLPGRAPRRRCSRSNRSLDETHDAPRLPSGIAEFDRVTGGGLRGSVCSLAIPASASRRC
jgi:hypothetical protein